MKILLLLSVLFGVTGCSSIFGVGEKDVNIKTVRVDRNIPIGCSGRCSKRIRT